VSGLRREGGSDSPASRAAAVGVVGDRDLGRFSPRAATRDVRGEIGAMALYAGESVDYVKQVQPAAEIMAELTAKL
jgi:hypothetical protein